MNNNREWFAENKTWYQECHARFVEFSTEYIKRLAEMDPALKELQPKDCIWRIYRDVRFSHDKRPYKEWFGVFPAAGVPGKPKTWGKKSMRPLCSIITVQHHSFNSTVKCVIIHFQYVMHITEAF